MAVQTTKKVSVFFCCCIHGSVLALIELGRLLWQVGVWQIGHGTLIEPGQSFTEWSCLKLLPSKTVDLICDWCYWLLGIQHKPDCSSLDSLS